MCHVIYATFHVLCWCVTRLFPPRWCHTPLHPCHCFWWIIFSLAPVVVVSCKWHVHENKNGKNTQEKRGRRHVLYIKKWAAAPITTSNKRSFLSAVTKILQHTYGKWSFFCMFFYFISGLCAFSDGYESTLSFILSRLIVFFSYAVTSEWILSGNYEFFMMTFSLSLARAIYSWIHKKVTSIDNEYSCKKKSKTFSWLKGFFLYCRWHNGFDFEPSLFFKKARF